MLPDALAHIDTLNARLRSHALPPSLVASIEADWEVVQTYNSNAIEGNTLSLAETKAVLLDGVTIGGHPLREHLEAVNHREAWRLMRRMASAQAPLLEDELLALHRTILSGIQTGDAGVYRRERVRVVGSSRIFPNPLKVPQLMDELLAELNAQMPELHPVILSAHAHYGLVAVHPFIDGNGRTARLLMNLCLIRAGYPPALLPVTGRAEYYSALEVANSGDLAPFEALIAGRVLVGLREFLAVVGEDEA